MRIRGRLIAASMLIGAAAGMYASKHLSNNTTEENNTNNNIEPTNQNFTVSSVHGRFMNNPSNMDTTSDTPISYEYDLNITADKSTTPTNIYFSNEAANPDHDEKSSNNTDNTIKIDMI